ncbi:hypothetical protein EGX88_19575 [Shigella flexneri]|nr:hypothetical protein EGX88_19575 [Shigella flexneri]
MPFYFRKECPLNSGYLSQRWNDEKPETIQPQSRPSLKWSTKTGHRVRVFPVSIFRFVWG